MQVVAFDWHQWLSNTSRVHQICFRPELGPEPSWSTSWFKGPYFYGGRGLGEEEGAGWRGRKEREPRTLIAPWPIATGLAAG